MLPDFTWRKRKASRKSPTTAHFSGVHFFALAVFSGLAQRGWHRPRPPTRDHGSCSHQLPGPEPRGSARLMLLRDTRAHRPRVWSCHPSSPGSASNTEISPFPPRSDQLSPFSICLEETCRCRAPRTPTLWVKPVHPGYFG